MEEPKVNSPISTPTINIEQQKKDRDKRIKEFWTGPILFIPLIICLIILGSYIRIQPLTDHNGHPGLIDITTGTWTLGPDLDPFLFLRYAKNIDSNGNIPELDTMRYVPLGYDTSGETTLLPRLIYLTKIGISTILNTLGSNMANLEKYKTIDFAAVIFPVIMFALTIIAFFLFIYSIFERKDKKMFAGTIASISCFFMIIMPAFLARTIAGIPEKESAGFFFLFISLYLFILTIKSNKISKILTFGFLSGITTAMMALIWGGVVYIYVTIALASLIGLIINKVQLEQKIGYLAWYSSSLIIIQMFTAKFKLMGFITSLDTGLATLAFGIISFSILVDQLKKKGLEKYIGLTWLKEKTKLPENILIILLAVVLILIAATIIIGPSFVLDKATAINKMLFNPAAGGRWVTTVAENQQPYFTQWYGNFGMYAFWIFVLGSILFFWNLLGTSFEKKEKMNMTAVYIFFFIGLVFSRYAPHPALFDGENFISKGLYLISALCFFGAFIYYYLKGEKTGRKMFDQVEMSWLLLLVLFILALFTARSAVRLIMVVSIIAPIFIAYLIAQIGWSAMWGDKTKKIAYWIVFALIIIFMFYSANAYYSSIKSQAYNYVPYYYTYQWQEAMSWVRAATPSTAVFAHWWDYGYWVQSLGNRATMTDGGNSITYWNYLTGRYVLTGDNQKDSLELLYAHNVSYLLIDSSDISKYGAFSQIGSDINYDRFSIGPLTMISDPKMMQETRNGYIRIYQGASYIDEDIQYNKTNLFKENSAIVSIQLEKSNNTFEQPIGIFYTSGQNIGLPIRYLYFNNTLIDFKSGINAAVYPIQNIITGANNQINIDPEGGIIYLSPRVLKGYLGQVYILNDAFNNFPNFKIAHTQPDYILQMISSQSGILLGDFVIYQGLHGPIKIWNVTYPTDIQYIAKYNNRVFPPEITWAF